MGICVVDYFCYALLSEVAVQFSWKASWDVVLFNFILLEVFHFFHIKSHHLCDSLCIARITYLSTLTFNQTIKRQLRSIPTESITCYGVYPVPVLGYLMFIESIVSLLGYRIFTKNEEGKLICLIPTLRSSGYSVPV